jgi:hypothetical protein
LTKFLKTYHGLKKASSTNVAGKLDICQQKTEARSIYVTLYKYQVKWIKDLNIRPENLKLIQERAGKALEQ